MKSFVKGLKVTGFVLLMLLTVASVVFGAYCFRLVMDGQFTWQMPYAPVKALAAMLMILGIACAGSDLFADRPREYGLTQIFVGCVILMTQFGDAAAQHDGFAIKYFAALFFLVQGIQNMKRKKCVRSQRRSGSSRRSDA